MDTTTLVLIALPLVMGGGLLATLLLLTRLMPGERTAGAPAAKPAAVVVPDRGPEYVQRTASRKAAYRVGWLMLVALAFLTVAEIGASLGINSVPLLFVVNLIEASLIISIFMHVKSVWSTEETH